MMNAMFGINLIPEIYPGKQFPAKYFPGINSRQ